MNKFQENILINLTLKGFPRTEAGKKQKIYNFVMKLKGAGQMQLAFSSDAHPCFVYITGAGF